MPCCFLVGRLYQKAPAIDTSRYIFACCNKCHVYHAGLGIFQRKKTHHLQHVSHVHSRFLDSQPRHPSYVEALHSHRSCDFLFSPLGRHVMLLLGTNSRLGRFNPVEKVLVQIGSSPQVGLPINNFESTTKLMSRPRFTIMVASSLPFGVLRGNTASSWPSIRRVNFVH